MKKTASKHTDNPRTKSDTPNATLTEETDSQQTEVALQKARGSIRWFAMVAGASLVASWLCMETVARLGGGPIFVGIFAAFCVFSATGLVVSVLHLRGLPPRDRTADQAMTRAQWTFGVLERLVPARISDEEIGDALEVIAALVAEKQPAWRVYLKVVATIFWVLVHGAHAIVRGIPKKKSAPTE